MRQRDATVTSAQSAAYGRILSPGHAAISMGIGAIAGLVPALLGEPSLSPLTGWIAAASLALLWVWRISWPQNAQGTKRLAEAESRSHSTDLPVLIGSATSIGGVLLALIQSEDSQNHAVGVALAILSVVATLLAWALVNTVFALKYARHYYLNGDSGIDFKQEQAPAYSDFAYLAFTVGMSYAVSDTEPATTAIRKTALGHALLSYGFGTIIIAVAINLITNLGQSWQARRRVIRGDRIKILMHPHDAYGFSMPARQFQPATSQRERQRVTMLPADPTECYLGLHNRVDPGP